MRRRPKPRPISTRALIAVGGLLFVTLGILAALYFDVRSRHNALAAGAQQTADEQAAPNAPALPAAAIPKETVADDDGPVIRAVVRADDAQPVLTAAPSSAPPTAPVNPPKIEGVTATTIPLPAPVPSKGGDSGMVPEITGPSYTAKKAMAAADAPAPVKPGNRAAKKTEAKPATPTDPSKTPTPSTPAIPPKTPAKTDPPKKAEPPKPPAKPDFSKAPTYVMRDGRRIRAFFVRDNGATVTVRNETGAEVTLKKNEIKEVVKA